MALESARDGGCLSQMCAFRIARVADVEIDQLRNMPDWQSKIDRPRLPRFRFVFKSESKDAPAF